MEKIKSAFVNGEGLQGKYEQIYKDARVWFHKAFDGEHSAILHVIKDRLDGCDVLDAGCGAGRLSIYCSRFARQVDGIDFSETAIKLARHVAACTGTHNVQFRLGRIEDIVKAGTRYTMALLAGVIEHVDDPCETLRQINQVLAPNAPLVVSCPGFWNFRGAIYMAFLKLLDLPMSLADLRQVSEQDIRSWAKETGFEFEKAVGLLYNLGWGEKAVNDLSRRIPAALRDKALPLENLEPGIEKLGAWMRSRIEANTSYLNYLYRAGILKQLQVEIDFHVMPTAGIDPKLFAEISEYLQEDVESDPYVCEVEPFCYQGGDTVYLLKKVRSVD